MKSTHDHLNAVVFAEVKDNGPFKGHIIASDGDWTFGNTPLPRFLPFTAFQRKHIAPEVFELLRAGPVMYTTLTDMFNSIQVLLNYFDQLEVGESSPLRGMLENMQSQVITAQSAARDGIESVVKQIQADAKSKGKK